MTLVVSGEEAIQGRRAVEIPDYTQSSHPDDQFYATLYMGEAPATAAHAMAAVGTRAEPQAYLVEQPPHARVPPHFHDTDQFQVFVSGEAQFGKQTVSGCSLHYAGGHTPYGPIVTDERGAHYFTLRVAWDSGGKPMPESRDLLKRGRQCHRMAEVEATPGAASTDVLPCEPDGLGATLYTLAAGAQENLRLNADGGGQYALVLHGDITLNATHLPRHSCVFRYPDEPPLSVTAGSDGATVLLMQFPIQDE